MSKKNHVDPAVSSGTSPTFRTHHALNSAEAEKFLGGVTAWYFEEQVRAGNIPFKQLGDRRVFDADDLEVFLASQPKVRITKITDGKITTRVAA